MLNPDLSLITLAEADAYHLPRLTPGWEPSGDPLREAACVRATDFLGFTYTLNDGVEADDPTLKAATCVLAGYALNSTLTEVLTAEVLSEEGDGIGKLTYGSRPSDPYPAVTAMLKGVATRNGGGGSGSAMHPARVLI